jgi:hypothetical protein
VFEGAEAAVARINVDAPPSVEALTSLRAGNDDVLDVRVVSL